MVLKLLNKKKWLLNETIIKTVCYIFVYKSEGEGNYEKKRLTESQGHKRVGTENNEIMFKRKDTAITARVIRSNVMRAMFYKIRNNKITFDFSNLLYFLQKKKIL